MRDITQLVRRHCRHVIGNQLLPAQHVEQVKAGCDAIGAGIPAEAADDQMIHADRTPIAEIDATGVVGSLEHVAARQRREQAAADQVGIDDAGDIGGKAVIARERCDGDRHRSGLIALHVELELRLGSDRHDQQYGQQNTLNEHHGFLGLSH